VFSSSKSKLLFIFEYILAVEVKDVAEAGVIVEANEADDNDEDPIDCVLNKLGCVAMQHFDVRSFSL
jgi:hypothetical protein